MVASIHLPQLLSRCTFWYSLFHSQHNYWVLIPKNSSDLGHYLFRPPTLNFLPCVQLHPLVRGHGCPLNAAHRRPPPPTTSAFKRPPPPNSHRNTASNHPSPPPTAAHTSRPEVGRQPSPAVARRRLPSPSVVCRRLPSSAVVCRRPPQPAIVSE